MKIDKELDELRKVASKHDASLYNICFRHAGVGFMWSKQSHSTPENSYGLVIFAYYPTISEAIIAEKQRFSESSS